jgi:hypothetical protein
MPEIDLDPRKHSKSYELKPVSRWWFVIIAVMLLLEIWAAGFTSIFSWAIAFFGVMLGFAILLCWPQKWLSKLD